MKRCPQCNSVFDDSLVYCTNDGTPLLNETFVLPSENSPQTDAGEEETVIHHDPITIEIRHHEPLPPPTEQFKYQTAVPPPVETVIVEKRRNTGKYLLFLVLGLVIGGGLVLATVLFVIFLSQRGNQPTVTNTTNQNSAAPVPSKTPTATPITASAKHEKRTDAPDTDFNGRVISKNAYVRSSPSKNSNQVDILPIDDRLEIAERASPSSPWFRVTCEHGTTGWMHGNTIKYTDTDSGF